MFFMSEMTTLSTLISSQVKNATVLFCKRRGLKLRHFIEQALIEQLEDEMDLEAYRQRRNEETLPLETILSGRRQKKR